MSQEVLDFRKCTAYEMYCKRYGKCLAKGQLESDLHVLAGDNNKRRYRDQNNRYLQRCEQGECQEIEIIRDLVEKLNQ